LRIEKFRIAIDSAEIEELRRRIKETRWAPDMPGAQWLMGMDAAFLRSLADYWCATFDWPRIEARLNETPQFLAITDSGAIHFAHIRCESHTALPIVLTHGWPGTFVELLPLAHRLANPGRYGRDPSDGFHVVIPSLPGFVFSSAPAVLGSNSITTAAHWVELMSALGYERFVAHGGDIGAGVSTALGLYHPEHVTGLHLNFIPGSYQPYLGPSYEPSAEEKAFFTARSAWVEEEGGYSHVQARKPDVLGPGLNDSPVGLAAWIVDKFRSWSDCDGDVERRFSRDDLLTTVSLYWFTRSMPSAIRFYWEGRRRPLQFAPGQRINVPVAIAHFPREIPIPPRSYVELGYNVVRWTEMPRGGHFAAFEETEALASDIVAFSRTLHGDHS
jgi:pimeloyl-ACP methyl ester carboxylesterase